MTERNWPRYPPGLPIPSSNPSSEASTPSFSPDFPRLPSIHGVFNDTLSLPSAVSNPRWHVSGKYTIPYHKKKKKKSVVSCGIICFYKDSKVEQVYDMSTTRILLVKRKDSLSYVEFIRGKYKPSDPLYIRSLVRGMTAEEHQRLLHNTFHTLWTTMWDTKIIKNHIQEYEKSFRRFEECKDELRKYILTITSEFDEPEWTYPKGRPKEYETDLSCATREFEEETGIDKSLLNIFREESYNEHYTGTNGILYENRLFLATLDFKRPRYDSTNSLQKAEVRAVEWIPFDEVLTKIRHTYPSREVILQDSFKQFLMKG